MNVGESLSDMDEKEKWLKEKWLKEKWLNDVIINKRTKRRNAKGNRFVVMIRQCVENFVGNLEIFPVMSILLIAIPVAMGIFMFWLQGIAIMGIFPYIALFLIAIVSSFSALFFDSDESARWVFFAFASYVMCAACDIVFYLPL